MSDQNDDSQNYALMALAGIVLLVVGGVLALAIWRGSLGSSTATSGATPAAATAALAEPEARIYFDLNSNAVPADALPVVARLAEAVRNAPAKTLLISGYHDASGDATTNAELSKTRAEAVRAALVAAGAPAGRLVLDKPLVTTGGADAREARRVELRLR